MAASVEYSKVASIYRGPLRESHAETVSSSIAHTPTRVPVVPSLAVSKMFNVMQVAFGFHPDASSGRADIFPNTVSAEVYSSMEESLVSSGASTWGYNFATAGGVSTGTTASQLSMLVYAPGYTFFSSDIFFMQRRVVVSYKKRFPSSGVPYVVTIPVFPRPVGPVFFSVSFLPFRW